VKRDHLRGTQFVAGENLRANLRAHCRRRRGSIECVATLARKPRSANNEQRRELSCQQHTLPKGLALLRNGLRRLPLLCVAQQERQAPDLAKQSLTHKRTWLSESAALAPQERRFGCAKTGITLASVTPE